MDSQDPDPYDWTRTTLDNRLAQAQARHNLSLAKDAQEPESLGNPRRRYLITGVMLFLGALFLAISDLLERRGEGVYEGVRAAGWLVWLASVFVAKPKGWRIPIYLVLTYFVVGLGSFSLYPLASVALNPQSLAPQCSGWNEYVVEIGPILDTINARDAKVSGATYAFDQSLRSAISDTEDVIRWLESADPPGAMEGYHQNLLGMQYKWIDFYHATLRGESTEAMLLGLHDDWVLSPHLRDDGNDKCAGE